MMHEEELMHDEVMQNETASDEVAENAEGNEKAANAVERGGVFSATFTIEGTFDSESWATALTVMNAGSDVAILPYTLECNGDETRLVLLGELRRIPIADRSREDRSRPRTNPCVPVGELADFLETELGCPCDVESLKLTARQPENLQLVRAFERLGSLLRHRGRGHFDITPDDFMTADEASYLIRDDGQCPEDGFAIDSFFLAECDLPSENDLALLCDGITLLNEDDRTPFTLSPFTREPLDGGALHVTAVGRMRRRGPRPASPAHARQVTEQLEAALDRPAKVTPLYPNVRHPEHMRVKRACRFSRSSALSFHRACAVSPDAFREKGEVEAQERIERALAGCEGTLFAGTLEFPAGTDMGLVARANGIMRSERGLRVAPLESRLGKNGSRTVRVVGMRSGFFGPTQIDAEDIVALQGKLGCKADVRLISGDMRHPDDLQLYNDALQKLRDPNAATSMAAWMRDPEEATRTAEQLQAELVGMEGVLARIDEMVAYAAHYRAIYGRLPQLHAVFTGNPGTGKTTVARLLARRLAEVGALEHGDRFVETDRSGLVGKYVGHTAPQTHRVVDQAMGGVLFIDEAYSLNAGSERDYGREAIDALVKRLEDDSDYFVCIMAGYTKEMDEMLSMNPGLRSRLPFKVEFPDYAADELMQVLDRMLDRKFSLTPQARGVLAGFLERAVAAKRDDFANARTVRNLAQRLQMRQLMMKHSTRIGKDTVQSVLADADIAALAGQGGKSPVGFAA